MHLRYLLVQEHKNDPTDTKFRLAIVFNSQVANNLFKFSILFFSHERNMKLDIYLIFRHLEFLHDGKFHFMIFHFSVPFSVYSTALLIFMD